MEFQDDNVPPLVYWNPWRRSSPLPVWPLNRMMFHNNTQMQVMQPSQMYSSTPPRIMIPTFNSINTFYNNSSNKYVGHQPHFLPQQPQFIPQTNFPTAKCIESNQASVTPSSLLAISIKQEPLDGFENKFNPTKLIDENTELTYNTLLPQLMNEVNKQCNILDVELPNNKIKNNTVIGAVKAKEQPLLSISGCDDNVKFQNGECLSNPITVENSSYIQDTLGLATDKQEEVTKAAKTLFSKRTRTLLHWLNPSSSKAQLKCNVSAAWDTLPDREKSFYISQVLGKFALHNSSLMVNPQLETAQSLPKSSQGNTEMDYAVKGTEEQSAVNSLFDSCDGAENWTSYTHRKYKKSSSKKGGNQKKRFRKAAEIEENKSLFSCDNNLEYELKLLQKMRDNCKGLDEFNDDADLVKEIEKFRLMSEEMEDNYWRIIAPDPDDLFSDLQL